MHRYAIESVQAMGNWVKQSPMSLVYFLLTGFIFYNFFWPISPHPGRAFFLLVVFFALFLRPRPAEGRHYERWIDWVLGLLSIVVFGYIVLFHEEISLREGAPANLDIGMGLVAIALSIEATRRGMGNGLAVVVGVFLAYLFLGQYLPPDFGGHVGYNLEEIAYALYLSTELDGIFGISTYVFARYIFLFFLYGNLLLKINATKFVMDFILALVGNRRGGAAMAAVTGSGALGSISGMAMGNVMVTGVITIPLMRKSGYQSWVAAGVEAAASSGGQIMPPVMGTASFLMMTFLSVPYMYIITAAVVPAILFYIAIMASVYFFSVRIGAKGVERSEIPDLREVVKRPEGLVFILSFSVLVALIILKYSPMYAVMCAILSAFIFSYFTPSRLSIKNIAEVITETCTNFVGLGVAAAGLGIVIGSTLQTGFAFGITGMLLQWTGGQVIPTLIAVFIACFFLGMGLPPVIVYIISVLLGVPALTELGISPIAAHLFCFYAAICCEVTPPIAPAAFVAAMVAKTSFWKVCIYSMIFSIAAHILPFAFALDNAMLLMGSMKSIIWVIGTATVGVVLQSWGISGPFRGFLEGLGRILVFIGGILMIFPGTSNVIVGVSLAAVGGVIAFLEARAFKTRMAGEFQG